MSRETVNSRSETCRGGSVYGRREGMTRPPFSDGKFGVYLRMGEGVDSWIGNCEFVTKSLLLRWREMDCWTIFLFLFFFEKLR